MSQGLRKIDHLIINSPYEEPREHWRHDRQTRRFFRTEGRRPAGYVRATPGAKAHDDPGVFVELPLVNKIRPRVDAWRAGGYPGVTGTTRRLLEHWRDVEQRETDKRLFFCQLEAIETLIWMTEADPAERQGIDVPSDGGAFSRLCCKLATGGGKTIVMAMAIAWHVLNKAANTQDSRFSKNVLIIAPGLTVRNRLAVLMPDSPGNFYDLFRIVPPGLEDRLRHGRVVVHNWHKLDWESEEKIAKRRSVDKRGAKSDERYVRDVLGEMANARGLLVINDEAHHAWRVSATGGKKAGVSKSEREQATKWVGGLDRIHRARSVLTAYDFSATPFVPTGKQSTDETLFGWIVSDFGLNDAIESGLVKTPRVVVRDDLLPDAKTYRSKLYHIYADDTVKDDLNQKAEREKPLPNLVRQAYNLLAADWWETAKRWSESGQRTPPVMITVANRTETAARVAHMFERKRIDFPELCDPERTLHIDSAVLNKAEAEDEPIEVDIGSSTDDSDGALDDDTGENGDSGSDDGAPKRKLTKKQQAEALRRQVDTVGKVGQPGERVQNVISVGMLSEGWDAKTVTHIMGLRAFSSQLLCEQVVGRGLRRTSYEITKQEDGRELFEAEYVNIFGVPFTFLPHEESEDGPPPPPPPPTTTIEPDAEKADKAMSWPNVVRIDHEYAASLTLDMARVKPLELRASETLTKAVLAPVLQGQPDLERLSDIDLQRLSDHYRLQHTVFKAAADVYDQLAGRWSGRKDVLVAQLVRIIGEVMRSDRIQIIPELFQQDDVRRRIMLAINAPKVAQHIKDEIDEQRTDKRSVVLDPLRPIRSTEDMRAWQTRKPHEAWSKCHINYCVYDHTTWEAKAAQVIDGSKHVDAWVKNDHLDLHIFYTFEGVTRKYRPDFLIRFLDGRTLLLEIKGRKSEQDNAKQRYLEAWVQAVNEHGGFGVWASGECLHPDAIHDVLELHATGSPIAGRATRVHA